MHSFHVPTIELLLSGLEEPLRAAIDSGLGTEGNPLTVLSFFDGIGGGWVALESCLKRWGLYAVDSAFRCQHSQSIMLTRSACVVRSSDIFLRYISIECDAKCRRVLRSNFSKVKSYRLIQQTDSRGMEEWGDIEEAEKAIVVDGKHRGLLESCFLVFNGFPCINVAGLNRAQTENGRQRSMREDAAGRQTGLFYNSERILKRILKWRSETAAGQEEGEAGNDTDDDGFAVSDTPF